MGTTGGSRNGYLKGTVIVLCILLNDVLFSQLTERGGEACGVRVKGRAANTPCGGLKLGAAAEL